MKTIFTQEVIEIKTKSYNENNVYIELMEQNVVNGEMVEESKEIIDVLTKENARIRKELADVGIILI